MPRNTFLALTLLATGCVTGPSQLSVSAMSVKPPSLMVAKPSGMTAYVVIDDARLPKEIAVLVEGADHGGKLTDLQAFGRDHIRRAFTSYFRVVEVASYDAVPKDAPVVIDVKVDRVEVLTGRRRKSGAVTYTAGAAKLTWGLGMRVAGSNEYLYSFAGESVGEPGEKPEHVFRTMFEHAIVDMLKGYTDKGVHQRVLEIEAAQS